MSSYQEQQRNRYGLPPIQVEPKAGHTPGPWRLLIVYDTQHKEQRITVCAPYNSDIAGGLVSEVHVADCGPLDPKYRLLPDREDVSPQRCNAQLIAKAPEMREALAALFEHCAMINKHWGEDSNQKQADKAIKDARALLAEIDGPQ